MSEKLIWMDLEMTGLDPDRDVIVSLALLITELGDYTPLVERELIVHQPEEALTAAPAVVREMHERSGLFTAVRRSTLELATAEAELLAVIRAQCGPHEGILAGNSIWQDRRFLVKYMPTLEGYLHYRQVDVTSLKLLARSWFGNAGRFDKPDKTHTALADVYASIDELRFYRQLFSAPQP